MNGSDNIESMEFSKESGDLGRNQLSRIDQTFGIHVDDKNSHSIQNRLPPQLCSLKYKECNILNLPSKIAVK